MSAQLRLRQPLAGLRKKYLRHCALLISELGMYFFAGSTHVKCVDGIVAWKKAVWRDGGQGGGPGQNLALPCQVMEAGHRLLLGLAHQWISVLSAVRQMWA